ncbi:putative lipid II flippase FtsW [Anaerolineales bacterium HSG6]|nr:putative lipid II flippase FtsW [Anaerolineales bacterium HSG6]MDM8529650.1 putative lipid II flippase FtsW [Anaerolineales bacterium HSG25]
MKKSKTPTHHNMDYFVLVTVAALLFFGLMMIYSATFALGYQQFDQPTYYFSRQLLWVGIGLLAMLIFANAEYHTWRRFSILIMAGTLSLMLLVLIVGGEYFGAQRWLFRGSIQPSELSKLAIIIYLADWLAVKGDKIRQVSYGVLPFGILLSLITGLIVLQQDLSTAILVSVTALVMFFIAGGDLWQIIAGLSAGAMVFVMLIVSSSYRLARITAFLDPLNSDPLGDGYQIRQILIALGSGGVTGLGLGASRQKFGYIPASHTDGIFAILGEELGLLGCIVVIGLFVFLAYRGFQIALAAPDTFGSILAVGITFSLVFQAIVNIGVVTASLPFTGIPLPFISFGGSSLVVSMASVGLLLAVSRRTMPEEEQPTKTKRKSRSAHLGKRNWQTRLV